MTSTMTLPPEEQTKPKLVLTKIWRCTDASCKAWVRDEFADEVLSACPICKGPVVRSLKHLPEVKTSARRKKAKQ